MAGLAPKSRWTYEFLRVVFGIDVTEHDLGIVSDPVLDVLTGDRDVGEPQLPRVGKSHGKIDPGPFSRAFVWEVGPQNVRQDLKVKIRQTALSRAMVHKVTVHALPKGRDVAIEWDRALSVVLTQSRQAVGAVLARVRAFVVRDKRVELLPVSGPSRLRTDGEG